MSKREMQIELEKRARAIGKAIGDRLPSTMGFCLVMFDFGRGGNATYVSNAERADMVAALEEMLGHLKAGTVESPITGGLEP